MTPEQAQRIAEQRAPHRCEAERIARAGGSVEDMSAATHQWLHVCYWAEMPHAIATGDLDVEIKWLDRYALPRILEEAEPPGEYIAGKWFSTAEIERADQQIDEAKGN